MRWLYLVMLCAACIPDINVSECIKECDFDSSACGAESEKCLDECADDIECSKDCVHPLTDCVDAQANGLVQCTADCIEEAEGKL